MLNPNNDRIDYGMILSPPDGYTLDFAIGTTYSLDLDALVGACISLGLSEDMDSTLINNPVFLLEALRSVGDKVALFCEAGQIHFPDKVTPLYVLLEKMVFQAQSSKRKGIAAYPSFHPKFWLIRYINRIGEVLYRIVVLSRNLTFDRSWDVSFYMDGVKRKRKKKENLPVCDFLNFLVKNFGSNSNGKEKIKKIRLMVKELPYIAFDIGIEDFESYTFIPLGIKNLDKEYYSITDYPLFQELENGNRANKFDELLIMSPFLSKDIVRYFNNSLAEKAGTEAILITRAMSLEKLKKEDCNNLRVFTMKDAVIDGEWMLSETEQQYQKQDIHAKMYLTRKGSNVDLYLGSMNASHNAVYGNVEFMLCLHTNKKHLDLEKLKKDLFNGEEGNVNNPFQQALFLEKKDIDEPGEFDLLMNAVKEITRLNPFAEIIENENGLYNIIIHFDDFQPRYNITVKPLLTNKYAPFCPKIVFENFEITELSEFYAVKIDDGKNQIERIIIIPAIGIPEERDKAIVSSIISDKLSFYRYVSFLLGDNAILSSLGETSYDIQDRTKKGTAIQLPALYEKMLQTAGYAPERLKEIDYLIQAVADDGVLPEGFEDMYRVFKKVVKV